MAKFESVCALVRKYVASGYLPPSMTMLDVGCRGCELRPYLRSFGTYEGADLFQNSAGDVAHVGDFSLGLPVQDQAYDVTFALDVLEHTDDLVRSLDELLRVTRRASFIVLPNLAHLRCRLEWLRNGHFGTDKYDMQFPARGDRHRWLTTASQADRFMGAYCAERGFELDIAHVETSKWSRIERVLGRFSRDLWVDNALYVVKRRSPALEVA